MEENLDDYLKECEKMFRPNPIKEKLVIAGIILVGIAIFFCVIGGSLYLAHVASNAAIGYFGLPPIN